MNIKDNLKKIKPLYRCWHSARVAINNLREKHKVEAYQRYGHDALRDVSRVVIDNQFECSCIYGTLLGLVRDGRLIPWDDDLDFVILDTPDFSWDKFDAALKSSGFWKYRDIESNGRLTGRSYKKRGVLCDFALWQNSGETIPKNYGGYQIPGYQYINGQPGKYRSWSYMSPPIKGFTILNCNGIDVPVPANYEELLAATYGEGWRIPDPDYRMDREELEVTNTITYYRKPLF